MSETEKRALCSVRVTLDGKPAVIGGVLNDFATVAQVPQGLAVEFAWDTVKRIVDKGGAFRVLETEKALQCLTLPTGTDQDSPPVMLLWNSVTAR